MEETKMYKSKDGQIFDYVEEITMYRSRDGKIFDSKEKAMMQEQMLRKIKYYIVSLNTNSGKVSGEANQLKDYCIVVFNTIKFNPQFIKSTIEYARYWCTVKFGNEYIFGNPETSKPNELNYNWMVREIGIDDYLKVKEVLPTLGTILYTGFDFGEEPKQETASSESARTVDDFDNDSNENDQNSENSDDNPNRRYFSF